MASSKLRENCVMVSKENILDKENISKIPRKNGMGTKRPALQCVDNAVGEANKRRKVGKVKKNEIALKDRGNDKKENAAKLDVDLLKIVENNAILSSRCQEISDLVMFKSVTYHSEFSEDILNFYKDMELSAVPKPNYMRQQPHITWNMRTIVVDWLVSVASEYKISEDALHLAVNYIDRFLCKISVVREKLQLVGAAAMLIAGKMEDVYPPMPKEWAFLTDDTYSIRQIVKMEQLIVKILKFNLQPPTSYTFIEKLRADHCLDRTTTHFAMYLSELVLLEGNQYLQYKPSEIAAAAICLSRLNLMKTNVWPREIEKSTGYTVKHLTPIVKAQDVTLRNSSQKAQQAVQTKYKSPKYGKVASLRPRNLMQCFVSSEEDSCIEIPEVSCIEISDVSCIEISDVECRRK